MTFAACWWVRQMFAGNYSSHHWEQYLCWRNLYSDHTERCGALTQLTPVCVCVWLDVLMRILKCIPYHFGRRECVWVLWRVHYWTVNGERQLSSSVTHIIHCVLLCVGVWMERCWHDTSPLWNIVNNFFAYVEGDIMWVSGLTQIAQKLFFNNWLVSWVLIILLRYLYREHYLQH